MEMSLLPDAKEYGRRLLSAHSTLDEFKEVTQYGEVLVCDISPSYCLCNSIDFHSGISQVKCFCSCGALQSRRKESLNSLLNGVLTMFAKKGQIVRLAEAVKHPDAGKMVRWLCLSHLVGASLIRRGSMVQHTLKEAAHGFHKVFHWHYGNMALLYADDQSCIAVQLATTRCIEWKGGLAFFASLFPKAAQPSQLQTIDQQKWHTQEAPRFAASAKMNESFGGQV